MVNYRRNFVSGGTFFFTVTLADRRSKVLVDHIDLLRDALRAARRERPFGDADCTHHALVMLQITRDGFI